MTVRREDRRRRPVLGQGRRYIDPDAPPPPAPAPARSGAPRKRTQGRSAAAHHATLAQQTSVVRPDRRVRRSCAPAPCSASGTSTSPRSRPTSRMRQTRLTALQGRHRARASRPRAGCRSSRRRSTELEAAAREPARGAAGGEGRRRHPAPPAGAGHAVEPVDSALHAAAAVQQALYAEVPFKLQAEGTYPQPRARSSTGSASSRESSTSATSRSRRSRSRSRTPPSSPSASATTFVLQEGGGAEKGAAHACRSSRRCEVSDVMMTTILLCGLCRVRRRGADARGADRRRQRRRRPQPAQRRRRPSGRRRRPAGAPPAPVTRTTRRGGAIRSSACSAAATIRSTRRRGRPGVPGLLIERSHGEGHRPRPRRVHRDDSGARQQDLHRPQRATDCRRHGEVDHPGRVVFSQDVNDPLSLVKQREVPKAVRSRRPRWTAERRQR